MLYLYYIFLGFLPSVVWLVFYLRKDRHPEPNAMVVQIFIWGMLISPIALVLELLLILLIVPEAALSDIFSDALETTIFRTVLIATLVPAIVEELLKYGVIRSRVLKNSQFDEPADLMLYFIIVALGFAAVENLLVVLQSPILPLNEAVSLMTIRFLGATLLHALAAGTAGYFIALGLQNIKKRIFYTAFGLTLAILFHACYNYLITRLGSTGQTIDFLYLVLLLSLMTIFVSQGFRQLNKQRSVCK